MATALGSGKGYSQPTPTPTSAGTAATMAVAGIGQPSHIIGRTMRLPPTNHSAAVHAHRRRDSGHRANSGARKMTPRPANSMAQLGSDFAAMVEATVTYAIKSPPKASPTEGARGARLSRSVGSTPAGAGDVI